jgi:hypothetical protein
MSDQLNISAQDVLAAIGFKAVSVATVVSQHAAGAPFPNPDQLVAVIEDMLTKAKTIQRFGGLMDGPHMQARASVKAELS